MNNIYNTQNNESSDELELSILFKGVWSSRNFIIILSIIGAVFSVFYALSIQNTYRSEATVLIESNKVESGLSQYSGLASMAGISLGDSSVDRKNEVMQIMLSRQFINKFANERDIFIPLFAFGELSSNKETYTLNEDIYDLKNSAWVDGAFLTKDGNPSYQEVYDEFVDHLKITEDFKTGFINISYTHPSPLIAKQWLTWLIEDTNNYIKAYDIQQSEKALAYLEEKLIKSSLPDINKALVAMNQEELRKMMLINIKDEYIIRTIDPPLLPLKKIAPSRASLCIIISSITFILSILFAVILSFFRYSIIINLIPPKISIKKF